MVQLCCGERSIVECATGCCDDYLAPLLVRDILLLLILFHRAAASVIENRAYLSTNKFSIILGNWILIWKYVGFVS